MFSSLQHSVFGKPENRGNLAGSALPRAIDCKRLISIKPTNHETPETETLMNRSNG